MKLSLSPHVFAREFQGEVVLLDLDGGAYFGLDPVAAAVWRSLEETGSVDDAVAAVCAEFDVDETRARADVGVFVERLVTKGIATRTA